jgi:calcineurin-like phosphoesterase family protein
MISKKIRDIWVVSDTHFGHDNIIKYCDRPFANATEMDEALIENWNSVVKDGDIVYHLGDVYFSEGHKALPKLKGRKRLILGNHDDGKDQALQRHFQKIMVWRMFPEFGLLLTHVPVHESALFRGPTGNEENPPKLLNVHGHIHEKPSPSADHRNVSVERTKYTPINIDELRVK